MRSRITDGSGATADRRRRRRVARSARPGSAVERAADAIVAAHRLRRARTEHQALEQRVAGQPVGAVNAGAGDLAGREQPRDRRASVQIGLDATHDVVRGGADGNPVAWRDRVRPRGTPARSSGTGAARSRDRDAPSSDRPARRCAATSRTIARETRSRDARSPAGS